MTNTILINKEHKIKDSYLDKIKLVKRKNYQKEETLIEEETALAFDQLKKFLKLKNMEIEIDDAYRSVEQQEKLKEDFIKEYGIEYTNSIVAEPGTSEHHTGLAIDICLKIDGKYDEDNDIIWKHLDQYKEIVPYLSQFGFILRYPKGKEKITTYPYEPWHIRYVGKFVAKIIESEKITLEEYLENYQGVLFINKKMGMTSYDIVNAISKLFGIKKVGHTGTLDPLAEGVLIVAIGKATKIVELLTSEDKTYEAGVILGITTDTLDITGNIIDSKPIPEKINIEAILNSFKKTYMQEVPIYSAVKVKGKKLYEYARKKQEVELPKKQVTIKEIELLSNDHNTFLFRCNVTKGCYIRSLIRDIGENMNTYATMTTLTRIRQGKVKLQECSTLEEIKKNKFKIHKIDEVLDIPSIEVEEETARKIKNGQPLPNIWNIKEKVILKDKNNKILGIYKLKDNKLKVWKNFI